MCVKENILLKSSYYQHYFFYKLNVRTYNDLAIGMLSVVGMYIGM